MVCKGTAAGICAISAVALFSSGCRTTRQILDDYEANYSSGNYSQAMVEVSEKADEGGDDELLWQLLAANAIRNVPDTGKSINWFDRAEDKMAENDDRSVFAQSGNTALAMMVNDKSFPYDGGGQDRVFTCLYKALGYASIRDNVAARTEFNRASQYQETWLNDRRKDIDAAAERLAKDATEYKNQNNSHEADAAKITSSALSNAEFAGSLKENLDYDPKTSGRLDMLKPEDWMNAYVSHATGVFRWMHGDLSRNYFLDASKASDGNPYVDADLRDVSAGAKPDNTVWIYVEDGLCPKRSEWRIDLPLFLIPYANKYVLYSGMAFPKLEYRPVAAENWSVATSQGAVGMAELENIDKLAKIEYDVYMRGALVREITRTVIKTGVQIALGIAADNVSGSGNELALRASQGAAAVYARLTTAADERCWTSLPKRVMLARVQRPADGQISICADGAPVATVTIPSGSAMVIVTKPSVYAPAAVQTISF